MYSLQWYSTSDLSLSLFYHHPLITVLLLLSSPVKEGARIRSEKKKQEVVEVLTKTRKTNKNERFDLEGWVGLGQVVFPWMAWPKWASLSSQHNLFWIILDLSLSLSTLFSPLIIYLYHLYPCMCRIKTCSYEKSKTIASLESPSWHKLDNIFAHRHIMMKLIMKMMIMMMMIELTFPSFFFSSSEKHFFTAKFYRTNDSFCNSLE